MYRSIKGEKMLRVAHWNYKRDNRNFDKDLELRMLSEEAQEFKDGLEMYFEAIECNEDPMDAIVEMVDAWCDYRFVRSGSLFKVLGSSISFDWKSIEAQELYMYNILTKTSIDLDPNILEKCFDKVIEANNAKGTTKVNGKVQKGDDWEDPKVVIFRLLQEA